MQCECKINGKIVSDICPTHLKVCESFGNNLLAEAIKAGGSDCRTNAMLTGDRRDEVARILEIVAKDGLPEPRDLDVALDAIEQSYLHTDNSDK
jgi:hypothetical protein